MSSHQEDLIYTKLIKGLYTSVFVRLQDACSKLCQPSENDAGHKVDADDADDSKAKTATPENPLTAAEPKRYAKKELAVKLPSWEIYIYTSIISFCFAASAYSLYHFSKSIEHDENYNWNFGDGWIFLQRYKDYGDVEWYIMRAFLYKLTVLSLVHAVSSQLVQRFAYEYRRVVWCIVGVLGVEWMLGWKAIIFIIILMTIYYLVSFTKSEICCFATCLLTLFTMNYRTGNWMRWFVPDEYGDERELIILSIAAAFLVLRFTSFATEKVKQANGKSDMDPSTTFTYWDLFSCTFYQPNLYLGPNFIYKYYQPQVMKPKQDFQKGELFYIAQKFVRGLVWMFILEGFLHYIYIHTCSQNSDILKQLPLWSLGGIVLYSASFYQAKYVVSYGIAANFMRLDHIVPPSNPRCITRVAYFSDYWRFFDPGLHAFFRNYIYIPLGGSRHGFLRQMLATLCCFLFVFTWHGAMTLLLAWTMSNFVAVVIELSARKLVRLPYVAHLENTYLSAEMKRRFHTLCNVPLYIFSTHAIMIFYTDIAQARIILDRLVLHGGILPLFMVCIFFFSMTMFSDEADRWEEESEMKNKSD